MKVPICVDMWMQHTDCAYLRCARCDVCGLYSQTAHICVLYAVHTNIQRGSWISIIVMHWHRLHEYIIWIIYQMYDADCSVRSSLPSRNTMYDNTGLICSWPRTLLFNSIRSDFFGSRIMPFSWQNVGGTLSEITDQELILRLRPLTKDCLKFQDYRVSVEKPLRFFCNATIVTIATLLSTTTSPHLLCSASSFSCFAGGYFGLLEWVNLCATLPLWK